MSPTVPTTGAGIATLNPIPEVPPGNVDLMPASPASMVPHCRHSAKCRSKAVEQRPPIGYPGRISWLWRWRRLSHAEPDPRKETER
ncbi:hypothetical protein GRB70_07725 [Bradyrhizobium neotropicale]|nr:hypothetical protein [Bradyrhizobium neotropicale]